MRKKIYSKEQLIFLIKDYAKKNGKAPSRRQFFVNSDMPSEMAYRTTFGSWGNAIIESGFEVYKPFPSEQCKKAVGDAKRGKTGVSSPVWKGGRHIDKHGYVKVWNTQLQKYKMEHRVVIQSHIGRELNKTEDVHHINGNKCDNEIENLQIITKNEHTSLHEKKGDHNQSKRKIFDCSFPECENKTSSVYGLCKKHYKAQWRRLKDGLIGNIKEIKVIPRSHSIKTRQTLSELAINQPRKNGRFTTIQIYSLKNKQL